VDQRHALLRARDQLGEWLGIDPKSVKLHSTTAKGELDLAAKTKWGRVVVEYKGSCARASVLSGAEHLRRVAAGHDVPVFAAPYLSPMARELCEKAGVSWMDLSGNARIVAPGLRIVIEGKPNAFPSRGRPATVFAPRSARVARHLLLAPARGWKQLELAKGTGLDDGSVSRIVRRLVEDRLLVRDDDNTLRVPDPSKLLDAWAADYDFTRHTIRAGHITATSGQALLERIVKSLDGRAPYAATGLAAAWLYTKFASFRLATVFLAEPIEDDLLKELGFRDEPRGANTWLVTPKDAGVFDGSTVVEGVRCVHPVQAYLDLLGQPERAKEAAAELRSRRLTWKAA